MEILELNILTNDINGTEKFYNGLLGLTIIEKDNVSISFLTQTSKLTFKKSEKVNPFYHFAFNIPNNKVENALTWASEKVDTIDIDIKNKIAVFEDWNANSFYFFDNNSNIVEFIARFDLDNESDSDFDSSSILSISEVGIPSDKVLNETQQTADKYELPYFSKQLADETFAVLGNDNGLLIFTATKRNWYPTDIKSERYWTKAKISNNEKIFEIEIK